MKTRNLPAEAYKNSADMLDEVKTFIPTLILKDMIRKVAEGSLHSSVEDVDNMIHRLEASFSLAVCVLTAVSRDQAMRQNIFFYKDE